MTNSLYGTFVKPRISAVWNFSDRATAKLIYAEAFQEACADPAVGRVAGQGCKRGLGTRGGFEI